MCCNFKSIPNVSCIHACVSVRVAGAYTHTTLHTHSESSSSTPVLPLLSWPARRRGRWAERARGVRPIAGRQHLRGRWSLHGEERWVLPFLPLSLPPSLLRSHRHACSASISLSLALALSGTVRPALSVVGVFSALPSRERVTATQAGR